MLRTKHNVSVNLLYRSNKKISWNTSLYDVISNTDTENLSISFMAHCFYAIHKRKTIHRSLGIHMYVVDYISRYPASVETIKHLAGRRSALFGRKILIYHLCMLLNHIFAAIYCYFQCVLSRYALALRLSVPFLSVIDNIHSIIGCYVP
jgi:hypothetical protein